MLAKIDAFIPKVERFMDYLGLTVAVMMLLSIITFLLLSNCLKGTPGEMLRLGWFLGLMTPYAIFMIYNDIRKLRRK